MTSKSHLHTLIDLCFVFDAFYRIIRKLRNWKKMKMKKITFDKYS